ncbi:MAG: hypothetical protein ISS70_18805 [Phycisphaerae bacterium]|nr:hypothetical protein [Phycisphaerae bacterium]
MRYWQNALTEKAEYRVRLLEHLSEDLQHKLGSGFSERNLHKMRQFYLTHKILPAAAKLSWPIIEFARRLANSTGANMLSYYRYLMGPALKLELSDCRAEIIELQLSSG